MRIVNTAVLRPGESAASFPKGDDIIDVRYEQSRPDGMDEYSCLSPTAGRLRFLAPKMVEHAQLCGLADLAIEIAMRPRERQPRSGIPLAINCGALATVVAIGVIASLNS